MPKCRLILSFILSLVFVSCATSQPNTNSANIDREPASIFTDGASSHESDLGNALGLQSVFFSYKSYQLSPEARSVIKKNAKILKNYPQLVIQIEGHCDQKGGVAYNLKLGERRASEIRKVLIREGIQKERLIVMSFGKGKPLEFSKEVVARNRRANFAILSS